MRLLLGGTRENNAAEDHDLMVQAGAGQTKAFEDLTHKHLRPMIILAQGILGNAALADEVAQEAFLRLWRQAPHWDPLGAASVRTWLSRVVTNLCYDQCRRKVMQPLDEIGDIEDQARDAFETLTQKDQKRVVDYLLSALPERQRTAIFLTYLEEMSGQEVAETMKLSLKAVESLLVRAKRKLRTLSIEKGFAWGENI
ncbi:MAG: sigma-70 family RNA polymerase sigma factor [Alphaproteobacteria bacterium]|nr:sigma-70 family RNA polymerase sigma factor [Alphaproteobacteria bacterium]